MTDIRTLSERLRAACIGHPAASIAWPHRLLHEAADALDAFEAQVMTAPKLDPRDPDNSRPGIFRNHNCAYCDSGKKPCRQGSPNRCEYPHARND